MELTPELTENLETFRRASRNGQPLLALESLAPIIDFLLAPPEREPFTLTGNGSAEFSTAETPKARTASSRKTTKATTEDDDVLTSAEQ